MFFSENDITVELLGVFKLTRKDFVLKSASERNYDSLSIRTEGRGHFKTETESLTVSKGDLLYIPKTASYSQQTTGETLIAIHFINYSFNKEKRIAKLALDNREYVEQRIQKMYDVWKEKKPGYRYECCAMLYELLGICTQQVHERKITAYSPNSDIKKAADYIHSHFRSEQIEITQLAEMCSVSETYFRKLFKLHYGVSPKRYIIGLQLETAAQLLQSQLYSVTDVCERSGFVDTKYFAKLFKSRYGCSPKQYQKRLPEEELQ